MQKKNQYERDIKLRQIKNFIVDKKVKILHFHDENKYWCILS